MDDFFYGIMEIDSLSGLASKNEQPQLDEISKNTRVRKLVVHGGKYHMR